MKQKKLNSPILNRRKFVQGTMVGAASAAVIGTPPLVTNAFASSGEIDILMWSDYLPVSFREAFAKETGIKINFTGVGSNEVILNLIKANRGNGFDICTPTNNQNLVWAETTLLQPFAIKKIAFDKINPAMARIGLDDWNFDNKGTHWLPHIWGTEGIAWRTDKYTPEGGTPSYGAIWDGENGGKTMGRPHSMMLGAGLYMETIGALETGDMWKAYQSKEIMVPIWNKVTSWCLERKKNVQLLWNDADSQKSAFNKKGVIVGQTWDGPPLAMKSSGQPIQYQAPKEGAMAWVDGLSIPIGAKNIDEIYAFINFAYKKSTAGEAINHHGYNSPVLGADQFANENYKKNFIEAYPGDALAKLNPWLPQAPWYVDLRTEFVNKFLAG
ncbi:MAG: extracellular solute-binding protein [Rhizobiaceae bacterium]